MYRIAAAKLLACVLIAGCASKSSDIAPAYVSPLNYQNYDCQQLTAEAQRISQRAAVAAGQQDKARQDDAVATTVGVVLFWPALFFIDGDGPKAAELAQLRGEMDAVEQASIQKNCNIKFRKG